MDRLKKLAAAILSIMIVCPPVAVAPAWAEASATVDAVDVAADTVRISLSSPVAYKSFVTATPARLVIELPDTEYQADKKSFAGGGQFLKDVRAGQFQRSPQMIARVVLDLKKATGYQIAQDGTDLVVKLGGAPPPEAPAPAPAAASSASLPASDGSSMPAAPAPAPTPAKPVAPDSDEAVKQAEKLTAGMSTAYSSEMQAAAKAADAGAPANAPAQLPVATRQLNEPSQHSDMLLRLPIDPVTLDFDNTDIRDVLRLMAAKSKMNIIYGPDVSGPLTLHLTNVPFNEAFSAILNMMNLTTNQVGDDVLRVLTPTTAQTTRSMEATATKVIPLNYAKAADLADSLNKIRTAEHRSGTSIADIKTNSLVVTESPEGLVSTEKLINSLDVRPQQVLIEVKLIEVGLTNSLNYGIVWNYLEFDPGKALGKQGNTFIGAPVGSPSAGSNVPFNGPGNFQGQIGPATNGVAQPLGASGQGTGVTLPASNIFGALTLGRVTNNYFLNATLTAAAAEGKVKVLSDPKVATLNNQPANINVTTQIPYVTANVSSTGVQTQTVQYVTTGIQLTVTPTINADGRITLIVNPNVSQPSATAAASVTGAPAINSRNATTTVMVDNGETIVIGGLISDSVSDQYAKIPLLGDIPILGWLFKKKDHTRSRSELLIFVTSRIMAA